MIKRYAKEVIEIIFRPEERLKRFDQVEASAVRAEELQGFVLRNLADQLEAALAASPPDEKRRQKIEEDTDHDFMAYVMERWEILGKVLAKYFHRGKTTFDIQDPADQLALLKALDAVDEKLVELMAVVREQGLKYWNVFLLAKTHGQGAHVIRFGKRLASYYADLEAALHFIRFAREYVRFGKMSDMVGDYQNTSPETEKLALEMLGLKPYYGATQILPRLIHAILATALTVLSGVLAKMAEDYQLMARSPNPLIQEPFGKKQVGSTANPAKKNSIKSEQTVGMFRLALGNLVALLQNLLTKEERDISQSSVERVALIDQFHILIQQLETMIRLFKGMVVYRDRMYQEIIDMRGTECGESAKEVLAMNGSKFGLSREAAYNLVKLASHIVMDPDEIERELRTRIPQSTAEAVRDLERFSKRELKHPLHIKSLIESGGLHPLSTLEFTQQEIDGWSKIVSEMLADHEVKKEWDLVFDIEHMLEGQEILREMLERGWMNFNLATQPNN